MGRDKMGWDGKERVQKGRKGLVGGRNGLRRKELGTEGKGWEGKER